MYNVQGIEACKIDVQGMSRGFQGEKKVSKWLLNRLVTVQIRGRLAIEKVVFRSSGSDAGMQESAELQTQNSMHCQVLAGS